MKVGITGGIGSGKSTICKVFQELGIPVYEADLRAKKIIVKNEVKNQVINLFGNQAYIDDRLNRDYIANIIFNDFEKREALNDIIHPAVAQDFNDWCNQHSEAPYLIKEAALFFETGSNLEMDKMILVTANHEEKIARILKRDPFRTVDEILKIMSSQLPDEEKIRMADFIIKNDNTTLILPQINKIHQELLTLVNHK